MLRSAHVDEHERSGCDDDGGEQDHAVESYGSHRAKWLRSGCRALIELVGAATERDPRPR
jgi:hypothetical protein